MSTVLDRIFCIRRTSGPRAGLLVSASGCSWANVWITESDLAARLWSGWSDATSMLNPGLAIRCKLVPLCCFKLKCPFHFPELGGNMKQHLADISQWHITFLRWLNWSNSPVMIIDTFHCSQSKSENFITRNSVKICRVHSFIDLQPRFTFPLSWFVILFTVLFYDTEEKE
jgi:hypothetical protein